MHRMHAPDSRSYNYVPSLRNPRIQYAALTLRESNTTNEVMKSVLVGQIECIVILSL